MIKAVIFDLDGTLLDSIDAFWAAFNTGVAAFNLPPISKERLLESMNRGDRLAKILGDFYPDSNLVNDSSLVTGIMAEIRKGYPMGNVEKVKLMTGALDLLNLVILKRLKVAMVTSRAMKLERLVAELTELNIVHYFDVIITAAESKRKPDPDTIIQCLQRLEVSPEECIVIGDSQADVIAGKAARVKTVAVTTGVASLAALAAESPDFIFDDLLGVIAKFDAILGKYRDY